MMKKLCLSFVATVITLAPLSLVWEGYFENQENYFYAPSNVVNRDLVVYNKVAKCGSSSLLQTAVYLSKHNNRGYTVYQHPAELRQEKLGLKMSKNMTAKEARIIVELPRPALYARHVYHINFKKFNLEKPLYINMVRDPVDRFISNFYFEQFGSFGQNLSKPRHTENINDCVLKEKRRCSSKYFLNLYMTRYFCGHDQICNANESEAIEIAKRNIVNDYVFIGLTEEFENSLKLLEKLLPKFFLGAPEAWGVIKNKASRRFSTVHKDEISPEARKILKDKMWADYEVYFFIKRRFDDTKILYNIF